MQEKAVKFYECVKKALHTEGVQAVILTLDHNNDIQATGVGDVRVNDNED